MNLKLLISVLIVLLSSSNSQGQSDARPSKVYNKDEQTLMKMARAHADALLHADTPWLNNNFADSYIYINPIGSIAHKSDAIAELRSKDLHLTSLRIDEITVSTYGNAGVTTELSMIKGHIGNMDISGPYRFTYMFVKLNGKWQIVAEQGTSVMQHTK